MKNHLASVSLIALLLIFRQLSWAQSPTTIQQLISQNISEMITLCDNAKTYQQSKHELLKRWNALYDLKTSYRSELEYLQIYNDYHNSLEKMKSAILQGKLYTLSTELKQKQKEMKLYDWNLLNRP